MTTLQDTKQYINRAAVDAEGTRIGKITKVYRDVQDRAAAVGPRGDGPAGHPAELRADPRIPARRRAAGHAGRVRGSGPNAPDIDADAHISQSEQDALRQYYRGLSWHRRVDQRSPGRRADATRGRQPGSQGVAPSIELRHYLRLTTARLGGLAGWSWRNADSADPQWK